MKENSDEKISSKIVGQRGIQLKVPTWNKTHQNDFNALKFAGEERLSN